MHYQCTDLHWETSIACRETIDQWNQRFINQLTGSESDCQRSLKICHHLRWTVFWTFQPGINRQHLQICIPIDDTWTDIKYSVAVVGVTRKFARCVSSLIIWESWSLTGYNVDYNTHLKVSALEQRLGYVEWNKVQFCAESRLSWPANVANPMQTEELSIDESAWYCHCFPWLYDWFDLSFIIFSKTKSGSENKDAIGPLISLSHSEHASFLGLVSLNEQFHLWIRTEDFRAWHLSALPSLACHVIF